MLLRALCLGGLLVCVLWGAPQAAALSYAYRFDVSSLETQAAPSGELSLQVRGLPRLWERDRPELPYDVVTLAVPAGSHAGLLRVRVGTEHRLGSRVTLGVAQEQHNVDGRAIAPKPSRWSASLYPPVSAELAGESVLHGQRLVHVRVYPLRYDAASRGVLLAEHIELELELESAQEPARQLRALPEREAERAEELMHLVHNAADLASMAYTKPTAVRADVPRRGFQPTDAPSLEGSPVEYLIITTDALAAEFQVLANWKTQRGVPAVVRTVAWINQNVRHGSDQQETIRNFIADAYAKWGVEWVLLAGDTDLIPVRYAYSTFDPVDYYVPTDLYYAGLDGNWNLDGDNKWGEAPLDSVSVADAADLYAEVKVGRLPVRTPAEAQAIVAKVIAYENPSETLYQGKLLLLGEVLFPTNWQPGQLPFLDGAAYSQVLDTLATAGSVSTRLYDNFASYTGSSALTKSATIAQMNAGYGFVNHIGHGYRYNMSCGDVSLVNNDAAALTNSSRRFVLYMLNCTAAAFDFPCLGEAFLKSAGGAVAVLGATRSAVPIPATKYNQSFMAALHQEGAANLGAAFAGSRVPHTPIAQLDNADRYTHYLYACLGDPAMVIHTTSLGVTSVTLPDSIVAGPGEVAVQVQVGGVPRAGALVCLQKGSEIYAVGQTDAQGALVLSCVAETGGPVAVTVSGANMTTWTGQIGVDTSVSVPSIEIFVADNLNGRVQRFDASGTYLSTWGTPGPAPGSFANPQGLAFDASGNLFVADNDNHRIQKFDASGAFVLSWGSGSGGANGQFNDAQDVAVDAAGNVYVVDRDNHRIQKFTNAGGFITKWGTSGSGQGQLNLPEAVAIGPDGSVYVSDNGNHRIEKFTSSGAYVTQWGSFGAPVGRFNDPEGLAIDAAGNVYVADRDNHRVQKFDSQGNFLLAWGALGTGNGQFNHPLAVTVSADGIVFVGDGDNGRVQAFDGNGTFQFAWGTAGPAAGQFNQPVGVALRPSTAAPAYVHVQSLSLDDGDGNDDAVLDAGELVHVIPTFINQGTSTAANVTGTFRVDSPWAVAVDSVFALGALSGLTTASPSAVLRLQVLPNAPDEVVLPLRFETQSITTSWSDVVNKRVHAPKVELVRLQVVDLPPGGNGNGTIEAGETFDLSVWFKNYGTGAMDGIALSVSTQDADVSIVTAATTLARLDAMQEATPAIALRLTEHAIAENALTLGITDAHGRTQQWQVTLRGPAAPGGPTLDPTQGANVVEASWAPSISNDVVGYHVYRALSSSGPWDRVSVDRTQGIAYFRDTSLEPSHTYFYRVTAIDASGNESPMSATSQVQTSPALASGWPIAMGMQSIATVAVGDVTGDGSAEIVAGAEHLYAWSWSGAELHDVDANPQTWGVFALTGVINAPLVLAELDPAPGLEIFAASWIDGHKAWVVRGDGSYAPGWPQAPDPTSGPLGAWGSPSAHDVDGDGVPELFVIGKNGTLYAWHVDGTPLVAVPQFKTGLTAWSTGSPSFADVDADGQSEIIYGARTGVLYVWNADGSDVPGYPRSLGVNCKSNTALGDVNRDGTLDIVMITGEGKIHVLDSSTGNALPGWPVTVALTGSPDVQPSPALADFDGDLLLEIVVATNGDPISSSGVYVFGSDGVLRSGWPQPVANQFSESSPIVADITGDQQADILFCNQSGLVFAWQANGTSVPGFPLVVGDFIRATPYAGDADGDGDVDLVLSGWDQNVWFWDLAVPHDPGSAFWPTLKHDMHRSGNFHWSDIATDVGGGDEVTAVPKRAFLEQNAPNPFNPLTTFAYGVPATAERVDVNIDVFDARGRHVRRLVSGQQAPGTYRTVWDGRDDSGRRTQSGVYFYRLRVASEVFTRKMILLK